MSERLECFKFLLPFLNANKHYAVFTFQYGFQQPEDCPQYDIFLAREEVKPALYELKKLDFVENISLASNFRCSKAIVNFRSGETLSFNFLHRFVFDTFIYLDPGEVLKKRTCNVEWGYDQASLEHAFEFSVLNNYLIMGWSEDHYRYFDEFHALVKEDLLEYMNQKYGTGFKSMENIFDYSEGKRRKIISSLQKLPFNVFFETFSIRWKKLLDFRSRASML